MKADGIAIVGAGIMGRMLAWQLVQAGARPVLYDRDGIESGRAAAYTAAGMLAPYAELESAEYLIFRMGMASLPLWEDLAKMLGEDIGYGVTGTIVVSHHQERAELLRYCRHLEAHLGANGESGYSRLSRDDMARREPELAETFKDGLYLPDEAWVNNRRVMEVLANALLAAGVEWHQGVEVESIAPGEIRINGKTEHFGEIVDCRGLGARGDLPRLRGVRGEIIVVRAPDVNIRHMVRLIHPRYRLYLVPGSNNCYLLGATQIESEDSGELTVRSGLELLSALYSLHRGFGEANIIGTRANCRPALPDNLPLIDRQPGLVRINGLFRHGFLLAPLLAREVTDMLEQSGSWTSGYPEVFREAG